MNAKITPKIKGSAKPSKDTVYVDIDDEITAIIDKIENAKSSIVALVLPKRATMLQSIVNMRLLKRSADNAKKSVVLITSEAALMPLAGAAGLHIAKNLQSKPVVPLQPDGTEPATTSDEDEPAPLDEDGQEATDDLPKKLDYHRTVGELAASGVPVNEEDDAIPLGDDEELAKPATVEKKPAKPPKDKKLKVPNFEKFRLLIVLGILGVVVLVVFIILAIFVLPKATITVKTSSIPVSANLNLTTSSNAKALDESAKIIPATLKTTDQKASQQVQASGQQNNGTKASGSVSMSAGPCSGTVPDSVPAGTGISTGGLTFITQSTSQFVPVIAGGKCTFQSSSSVAITSQNSGAKYNVGSGTVFSVSGRSDVSATGSATGGTDNIITVVSQSDLDSAKSKITSADTDKFTKDFENQLAKEGNYVLTSTLKPSDPEVSASPDVGQPASTVNVNIKITYSVLVVSKADLTKAINDSLNKQIDKSKQKLSTDDVLKSASVTVQSQSSPTSVSLNIKEDTTAVPIIDVDGIKKQVGGLKSSTIKENISSVPGVKEVDVKLSPFWVSKAPKKPSRIDVVQQQIKD